LEAVADEPGLREDLQELLGNSSVLRRAALVERVLRGSRLLWVDDYPEGNIWEHDCLTALGANVKTVETTRSALACIEREGFDLILSDVAREGDPSAGLDALPELRQLAPDVPVVLYVSSLRGGVPPGAFGITNRPDELLHLCMDTLERQRA
jgi:hypothetical protein